MTIQEEIKEWIAHYLTDQFLGQPSDYPANECYGEANKILKFLDSKGVVIKTGGKREYQDGNFLISNYPYERLIGVK
jgi:hypothetical protein